MIQQEKKVQGENPGNYGSGGSVFDPRTPPFTGDKPSDGGIPITPFLGSSTPPSGPDPSSGLGRLDTKPAFSPKLCDKPLGNLNDDNKKISSGVSKVLTSGEDSKLINSKNAPLMTSPPQPATIENLPEEILSDIFIRLLAKQLAQMRSVCKSWNALLSQPSFMKSHLNRSIQNNSHQMTLLAFYDSSILSSDELEEPFAICTRPNLPQTTNSIKPPINPPFENENYIRVFGSVNGLICFSFEDDSDIHIWNPSLSAVLTLPPNSTPSDDYDSIRVHFRFAFDPKTDDYKVIKSTDVIGLPGHDIIWWLGVEIYSMRKGIWESIIETFPSRITSIKDTNYVCVDGHEDHLHWLGYDYDRNDSDDYSPSIVAFDLDSETFHEIPLPDSRAGSKYLGVLTEKLCVISCDYDLTIEVWVMDEYGVAESWVKRHVFSPSILGPSPYGFTSHNEFVDGFRPFYNPVTQVEYMFSNLLGHHSKIVEYVDSLVWVTPDDKH